MTDLTEPLRAALAEIDDRWADIPDEASLQPLLPLKRMGLVEGRIAPGWTAYQLRRTDLGRAALEVKP